ncbi:glutamine synthetase family protein [Streptomyces sp. NPDC087437]|uniref:glutamine synthetase family protein n=1 Tax=Streptomyces sp. NPDC087437 TaxID=3365789 RepID=UPI003823355D
MSTAREERARAAGEADRLTAQGVSGVVLTMVDTAGITRIKTVPVSALPDAVRWGVAMPPVFDLFLADDSVTGGGLTGAPEGDLRLLPDLGRLTPLAAQPGWAWAPADRHDQRGTPYPGCQRLFARRMTERAAERGLALRMGFETEWVVDRDADPSRSRPAAGPAYGMARFVELSDYLRDVLDALVAQGVAVQQLHPEYAPGQFEVSVAPSDPVGAADLAVLVRETVRAVSARHGLTASFAPVVEAGAVGNGRHLHLSLWQDGRNLCRDGDGDGRHGMTAVCEAFLAGVLRELPALLALGAPSAASYLRLEPSRWAGAFQCWGPENREAAIRFVAGAPDADWAANAEIKSFDAAANPYLAVGAVIAAGLAGIDAAATLPPPVVGDPAEVGGHKRLPTSLTEALAHFERSAVLREALGEPLFGAVVAVRRAEAARFEGATPQSIVAATRLRY